jgi:hypothetical protein
VVARQESGAAEGACRLAGEARAPVGGESGDATEVPTAEAAGGGGGIVGAQTM